MKNLKGYRTILLGTGGLIYMLLNWQLGITPAEYRELEGAIIAAVMVVMRFMTDSRVGGGKPTRF